MENEKDVGCQVEVEGARSQRRGKLREIIYSTGMAYLSPSVNDPPVGMRSEQSFNTALARSTTCNVIKRQSKVNRILCGIPFLEQTSF